MVAAWAVRSTVRELGPLLGDLQLLHLRETRIVYGFNIENPIQCQHLSGTTKAAERNDERTNCAHDVMGKMKVTPNDTQSDGPGDNGQNTTLGKDQRNRDSKQKAPFNNLRAMD